MKKLSVLFAAIMLFTAVGFANAQKIASLDVATVLNAMPEKKAADQQLQTFSNTKQAEIKKQADAADAKLKQYSEEAPKKSADENKAREAELQKLNEQIQQMAQAAQKDFAAKQDTAYAPVEKKFNDAVSKVAKANGWDFILDSTNPALIYKAGPDATDAVKKELGL